MENASSNAGLIRRIVQLEKERDELQRDVESLCIQQSGGGGIVDVVSRIQARRAVGFEQELEACKQKLALHIKENIDLQDELSKAYLQKDVISELYKSALDKNKEVENEVKFYQSRMAAAFGERDKAFLEADRCRAMSRSASQELKDLKKSLEQARSEFKEQEVKCAELEQAVDALNSEIKLLQQGDLCKLQADQLSRSCQQLEQWKGSVTSEFRKLQVEFNSLKANVRGVLEKERVEWSLMWEDLQNNIVQLNAILEKDKLNNSNECIVEPVEEVPSKKALRVHFKDVINNNDMKEKIPGESSDGRPKVQVVDDSKEVLAQALHEKVGALLLLSQQEERHYLETRTRAALEEQNGMLTQKLSQVTDEKVTALMQLAEQREEFQRLEERERELVQLLQHHRSTDASGRLLPARWSVNPFQGPMERVGGKARLDMKHGSVGSVGYLKGWLRVLDLSSSKTTSSNGSNLIKIRDVSQSSHTDEPDGSSRLRVENAGLQDRLASILNLTESAHRLRMTLVKVASNLQQGLTPTTAQASMEDLENVNVEAKGLKVALGWSLPISYSELVENSTEEFVVQSSGTERSELPSSNDTVSLVGMEMVELLLTAVQLQKAALDCNMHSVQMRI